MLHFFWGGPSRVLKHPVWRIFFDNEPERFDKKRKQEIAGLHFDDRDFAATPLLVGLFAEGKRNRLAARYYDAAARNLFTSIESIPVGGKKRPHHVVYQSVRLQLLGSR